MATARCILGTYHKNLSFSGDERRCSSGLNAFYLDDEKLREADKAMTNRALAGSERTPVNRARSLGNPDSTEGLEVTVLVRRRGAVTTRAARNWDACTGLGTPIGSKIAAALPAKA